MTPTAANAILTTPVMPNVTKVTKEGPKVKVGTDADDYQIPFSPHSDKAPDVAARAFLKDAKDAGVKLKSENGFVTGATRNITNIRGKAAELGAAVPGVSSKQIAAQFEGAKTRQEAMAHRDYLMKIMPQAAPALSHLFSDAEISKIWTRK
jgi:hypothetical protein